jgi:3-dehydrosphinganine reductase
MKIKAQLEPGKVALVTGGSSGMGKAVACALAEHGMNVWIISRRKDVLEAARMEVDHHRKSTNQLIATISADVSDRDQVHQALQVITEKSGCVDLLVNAVGAAHPGYVQDLDVEIFTSMMDVNYFGTVYVTKETLPLMLKKGAGYIVNTSSIAGFFGTYGYTAYGASKYAVRGFSSALRAELRLHNIGVSVVYPPNMDTPGLENENKTKPPETKALEGNAKEMSAEAVAREIINGIQHCTYDILPGFESKLVYRLNGVAGGLLNVYLDRVVANTYKKSHSSTPQEA